MQNTRLGWLKISLRKAWAEIEQEALDKIRRLKAKLELAETQKTKLIMSLAENPELKDDLQEVIAIKKEEISIIASELDSAQDIEADFNEFVEFALDFVDNLKANWWELDHEDRLRCEQLIFPQYLRINEKRKVSTPEISVIYRYGKNKKTPEGALNAISGGAVTNEFKPIIDEFQRWRTILNEPFQQYNNRYGRL